MVSHEGSNPYVPVLARARAEGVSLPDGEPLLAERWTALFVIAHVLRRRSWKEELTLHSSSVAHVPRGAPPTPQGYVAGTYLSVEDVGAAEVCQVCARTPRVRPCRVCNGIGFAQRAFGQAPVKCSCEMGHVPCPSCLGQGATNRITVRYYEDAPRSMREFWIPSHLAGYQSLFRLERALEEMVDLEKEPPEQLRCHDLTGRTGGSAYRGGQRIERPSFYGHDFGDTIERALASLKALGGGMHVIHHDTRAYAWPLLRLRYDNPKDASKPLDIALYVDREGKTRAFGD